MVELPATYNHANTEVATRSYTDLTISGCQKLDAPWYLGCFAQAPPETAEVNDVLVVTTLISVEYSLHLT